MADRFAVQFVYYDSTALQYGYDFVEEGNGNLRSILMAMAKGISIDVPGGKMDVGYFHQLQESEFESLGQRLEIRDGRLVKIDEVR